MKPMRLLMIGLVFPAFLSVFLSVFPLSAPLPAQEPPVDNIGHTRHRIKHGQSFSSIPSEEGRFSTSRESQVTLRLPVAEDMFSFVVLGDRTSGRDRHVSILADAVHEINLLEPAFVMNVGDMVQGYNTTPDWLRQMKEYKGIMNELKCPWFPTPGNHDVYWGGDGRPKYQHEDNYEAHFGPLWYAFEYRNCRFIVLFTDEGDRESGAKNFSRPELQTMTDGQFQWLRKTLEESKEADHVFVFQHQPRWQNKRNYGDDWDRVHDLFVRAGNVTAVFAGHTHTMRYENRDGIDYFTLSTTGGNFNANGIRRIGYRDNFLLLNVRKDRIAVASLPVEELSDPREMPPTLIGELQGLLNGLRRQTTHGELRLASDGAVESSTALRLENTTSLPIQVEARLDSRDSRWETTDYPQTLRLEPGEQSETIFAVRRGGGSIDRAFRELFVRLNVIALSPGTRIPFPELEIPVPIDLDQAMKTCRISGQSVLQFHVPEDRLQISLPGSLKNSTALTLETWFLTDQIEDRVVLINNGAYSELALILDHGRPQFHLPVADRQRVVVDAPETIRIRPDRWQHLAGVYDGKEIRLYLDGVLLAKKEYVRKLPSISAPVFLGAAVDRFGDIRNGFVGLLDSVRLSNAVRYEGDRFEPQRDFQPDEKTLILLDMQESVGRCVSVRNKPKAYGRILGDAAVVPELSKHTAP